MLLIGVPSIEKLVYTKSEDLSNLFIQLLKTAANEDTVGSAHPSFVNIIGNLSADEARILNSSFITHGFAWLTIRHKLPSPHEDKFANVVEKDTILEKIVKISFSTNVPIYLSNMVGLGLLESKDHLYLGNQYDQIKDKPKVHIKAVENSNPDKVGKLEYVKGSYEITKFGEIFIKYCTKKVG